MASSYAFSYCTLLFLFIAVTQAGVSQSVQTPSSSNAMVQPMTMQTSIHGLTTTSSLLSTSGSTTVQAIAPHVQQVPVSVSLCLWVDFLGNSLNCFALLHQKCHYGLILPQRYT